MEGWKMSRDDALKYMSLEALGSSFRGGGSRGSGSEGAPAGGWRGLQPPAGNFSENFNNFLVSAIYISLKNDQNLKIFYIMQ